MKVEIIALLTILLSCCNYKGKTSDIIVIFKDTPNHSSSKRYNLTILPRTVFNYVDNEYKLCLYSPKLIGYDTLRIPSFNGYAEVMHRNQAIEDNYYLLKAGDTVMFTYGDNLRPQIRSLHNDDNSWLYNIPNYDTIGVHQATGYRLKTICTSDFFLSRWNTLNSPKYKNDKAKQEFIRQKLKIYPNVDSLQPIYQKYEANYTRYIDSLESSGDISSIYANFYRGDNNRSVKEVLLSDSLLRYPSSHAALHRMVLNLDSVGVVKFCRDSTISIYAKLSALEHVLQSYEESSWGYDPSVISACSQIYTEFTGEVFGVIEESEVSIRADAGDMIIEDLDGVQITFDILLEQFKGKVVYVDLWASWCGPCIASMPYAEELRKEFYGQDVVFVFLGVRDGYKAWQESVMKHNLSSYNGLNYFVVNSQDSRFLKEVDNRTIPQYLLYDRSGKLIKHRAPSPSSNSIRQELFKLLTK